jgi:hypothetical protein
MDVRHTVCVAAMFAISVTVSAQDMRRDGRWEMTATMEIPGMPQPLPPTTLMQCITKEQAADPQKLLPQPPQRGGSQSDCKVSDYKSSGNKVTFAMKCTTPQEMTTNAEINYGQDTMQAVMKTTMSRDGKPMEMTMKMTGKRLGDCTQ